MFDRSAINVRTISVVFDVLPQQITDHDLVFVLQYSEITTIEQGVFFSIGDFRLITVRDLLCVATVDCLN